MNKKEENAPTLIQLVYVSAATVPFGDEELDALLTVARTNNSGMEVTGMLLFEGNTFFQVLEGEKDTVQELYEKIEQDERHDNVLILARREIAERNFGDWSMGFTREKTVIENMPGFVNFFSDNTPHRTFMDLKADKKRIQQILEGFRRGRWRRKAAGANA